MRLRLSDRHRSLRALVTFVFGAATIATACDVSRALDATRNAPGHSALRTRARALDTIPFTTGAILANAAMPTPPVNNENWGTVSIYDIGVTLPRYALFSITVSGGISVSLNPQWSCCFHNPLYTVTDTGQTAGPRGLSDYMLTTTPLLNGQSVGYDSALSSPYTDILGPTQVGTDSAVVGFSRGGDNHGYWYCANSYMPPDTNQFWCVYPDTAPWGPDSQYFSAVYSFSGTQTVTVYRFADNLVVSTPTHTDSVASAITFTAAPADTSQHVQVFQWIWSPDAGSDSTQACPWSQNPCTTTVYSSGVMSALVVTQGRYQKSGVHVHIGP
jgi:hypothetical protein